MPPKIKSKYNNVYIPADLRDYLEKIVVEIGYRRGRQISASAVVHMVMMSENILLARRIIHDYGS